MLCETKVGSLFAVIRIEASADLWTAWRLLWRRRFDRHGVGMAEGKGVHGAGRGTPLGPKWRL